MFTCESFALLEFITINKITPKIRNSAITIERIIITTVETFIVLLELFSDI